MAITAVHTPLTAFLSHVLGVLYLAIVLISVGGWGCRVQKICLDDDVTPLEACVFSLAIGWGILSLLMTGAGVLGLWSTRNAWVLCAAGLLTSHPFLKNIGRFNLSSAENESLPIFVTALCALWGLLLTCAPITYYDSLIYHMAMPAAYIQAHHWVGLKSLIYSAFPQNLEMLWTFGLLLLNDQLSNLIGFSLAVLTVLATWTFARRFLDEKVAAWAVMLLSAMPAFLLLSSGGYVDVGLTFFSFLSLYTLCLGSENPRTAKLVLAGIFAGWAMGTKYTGALTIGIGILLVVAISFQQGFRNILKNTLVFMFPAILVMSPWLIKNIHYVGNPLFPFFYGWGNPKLSPWVQGAAQGYFRGISEYQPRSLSQLLTLPVEIIVRCFRFGGGMDVLGDFGWAPFIGLLPGLIFYRSWGKIEKILSLYSLLFFMAWAMTRPVLRFLLPIAPVLALLSALVWARVVGRLATPLQWVARLGVAALLLFDFFIFFYITSLISPFSVALGMENRETYLARKINYYVAAQYINQLPDARIVFVLGDQRGYYYNKPAWVTPVFNQNPLVTWANEAASPEDLLQRMRQEGITHILVNEKEMIRLAPYGIFSFTHSGLLNWESVRDHSLKHIYQDSACGIFQL